MILMGLERIALQGRMWIQGYFKLQERGNDETDLKPDVGYVHIYVKTVNGATKLFYKDDLNNEHQISVES